MNDTVKEIREHMARAFFACAWADLQEESPDGANLSGYDIMAVMPETIHPNAYAAADRLIAGIQHEYPQGDVQHLMDACAAKADSIHVDRECTAEYFGHYAAMQAMGSGVGLESVTDLDVGEWIPWIEFYSCDID